MQASEDVAVVAACPGACDETDDLVRGARQGGEDRVSGSACRTNRTLRTLWALYSCGAAGSLGTSRTRCTVDPVLTGRSRWADRADSGRDSSDERVHFCLGDLATRALRPENAPSINLAQTILTCTGHSPKHYRSSWQQLQEILMSMFPPNTNACAHQGD